MLTASSYTLTAYSMFIAIVPAYNEEDSIGSVTRNLFGHVDEVVVVDDGSRDRTAVEARLAGATVLRHRINRGQGAALETGHEYARRRGADMVIHFDGDGQFDVADIAPAVTALRRADADVLLGSRFLGQASNIPFTKKYILFPLGRLFHRVTVGLPLTDVHNGFRLLTGHALSAISLRQDRMAHATEILMEVKRHRLRYIEFPVKVVYHEYGQRMSGSLRIIGDLMMGTFVGKK